MTKESRTITNEQFKNMTVDDMMIAIYFCQEVDNHKDADSIVFQLIRIMFRLVERFDLDGKDIEKKVKLDELAQDWQNQIIAHRVNEIMIQNPEKDSKEVWSEVAADELNKEDVRLQNDVAEEDKLTPEAMLRIIGDN